MNRRFYFLLKLKVVPLQHDSKKDSNAHQITRKIHKFYQITYEKTMAGYCRKD